MVDPFLAILLSLHEASLTWRVARRQLARPLFTGSAKPQAVVSYPRIHESGEDVYDRHAIHPYDPTPAWQLSRDLVYCVRANVDRTVQRDQPHSGVEIHVGKGRNPFDQLGLLPGNEFELSSRVPTPNPLDLTTTESTLAIVDHDELGLFRYLIFEGSFPVRTRTFRLILLQESHVPKLL